MIPDWMPSMVVLPITWRGGWKISTRGSLDAWLYSASAAIMIPGLIALAIGLGLCWIFLRRIYLVIIAAIPTIVAITWLRGGMFYFGQDINLLTGIAPTIILVIVLLVFGGAKLPKLARSLGQAQKEFKSGLAEGAAEDDEESKA